MCCLRILLVTVAVLLPLQAQASVIWSWSFDQTEYVVGPFDSIVVGVTLLNEPSSTEDLQDIQGVSASFTGDLQKTYNFTFGTDLFGLGLDLAPGESFSFIWGTLTPIGTPVAPGVYPSNEAHLALNLPGTDNDVGWVAPTNTFQVRVVPEPEILPLLLTAFGLWFGFNQLPTRITGARARR